MEFSHLALLLSGNSLFLPKLVIRSITKNIHDSDAVPHVVAATINRALEKLDASGKPTLDVAPKKIGLDLTDDVVRKIFFAETALG